MDKKYVLQKMRETFQIQDKQTVFQHGVAVLKKTKTIIEMLKNNAKELPLFLTEHRDYLLKELVDYKALYLYCLYHDCGKPFCKPDS